VVEAMEEVMAAVIGVGAVVATGVAMAGGVILTGGTTLIIPTTIPIPMGAMGNRRCLHKELPLRQNRDNSNVLIGTSVRTQRVTTPTSKIARVVG